MFSPKSAPILLSLLTAFFGASANATVHIAPIDPQTIDLGTKLDVVARVTADEPTTMDLSIATGEIANSIQDGDISIQPSAVHLVLAAGEVQDVKFVIQTKTSAPSFAGKKLSLEAKSSASGEALAEAEIALDVAAIYIVNVLDGADKENNPFDFDSSDRVVFFRSHAKGLQLIFNNMSSSPVVIHGMGAIAHQMTGPLSHGESYRPALILPAMGDNVAGDYTIHGVYHPDRNAVFNATQFQ